MEVPEKLYVDVTDNPNDVWLRAFRPPFVKHNSIEYTRTDVFINKACEWLNNFYNNETRSYLIAEDIQEFKKSMKGE